MLRQADAKVLRVADKTVENVIIVTFVVRFRVRD